MNRSLALERFQVLTNQDCDPEDAIRVLEDIWSLVPSYIQCILEGLQLLEDRGNPSHTDRVLRVLRVIVSQTPPDGDTDEFHVPRVTTICFISDGYVDCLAQSVQRGPIDKLVSVDEFDQTLSEEGEKTVATSQ
ncbi:uncharacterized protein HMPREF1541_10035 [Cyphellophora europaea CBS 101466]|uniref:Uncharacterized protein n=1 Tax=Cyphellophora europaea (strain CBS 101466) TaxID=1220924 RepID=W2SAV8_CYPE1|nr:uncharacterized protein HMPREF1541_10035 [Cyphellophora europaea CBS 101466]ETN45158.1 hypothetical protein HMPREF1541_10035 [Cyphellophora europaea CBS 101466]